MLDFTGAHVVKFSPTSSDDTMKVTIKPAAGKGNVVDIPVIDARGVYAQLVALGYRPEKTVGGNYKLFAPAIPKEVANGSCHGLTKQGEPCRRKVKTGTRCYQHPM